MSKPNEQQINQECGQEVKASAPSDAELTERRQAEDRMIKWLKVAIVIGLSLLGTGHYLLEYANLPETMGVNGMIISASCIAFGLVFSLPTKMYLTFLLMKREAEKKRLQAENTATENTATGNTATGNSKVDGS